MRFSKALPLLFDALKNENIDYALIGGLALYTLGTDMGQVDFLFAHRHYALEMMTRAKSTTLLGHPVKVVSAEDLIGLKIQASSNDPNRCAKDQSDIEEIVRQPRMELDWKRIEEYYRIFNRESEFRNLKERFQ